MRGKEILMNLTLTVSILRRTYAKSAIDSICDIARGEDQRYAGVEDGKREFCSVPRLGKCDRVDTAVACVNGDILHSCSPE